MEVSTRERIFGVYLAQMGSSQASTTPSAFKASSVNAQEVLRFVETEWDNHVTPCLMDFIKIPNVSPLFDPEWNTNGLQEEAAQLLTGWVHEQNVQGLVLETIKAAERSPLILVTIEAFPATGSNDSGTVLLYGHLDKQPPLDSSLWMDGFGPRTPVVVDGERLYGRGAADDGYSIFTSILAIRALQKMGVEHPRCVVLIEASEESGSNDLPFYMEELAVIIGRPSMVICLDSGCGNYEQFWLTTSLRGDLVGDLRVDIVTEGLHSGDATGIVPGTFRIGRMLLSRLEDEATGTIHENFQVSIPENRIEEARSTARSLKAGLVYEHFPWVDGAEPLVHARTEELLLNRSWKAALAVTGVDGIPSLSDAGNVLRPHTTLKLGLRVPPTLDVVEAARNLKALLQSDPPYGAHVSYTLDDASPGWNAPTLADWLKRSLGRASMDVFGSDIGCFGEGGSIPFMGMLAERFPDAQFVITGVLGPESNAHGPNEFLHLPMVKKITTCIAVVLADAALNMPRSL